MYLKDYENHLKGIQVMPTISLQCNSLSKIHSSAYFRLKQVDVLPSKNQALSLGTIVLNSRDWYEIIWFPEISRFKNQPCNRFYPKNQLECIGKAVMMLYLG